MTTTAGSAATNTGDITMNLIRRFAGNNIPPYFLGRPRHMYEGRYGNSGRPSAGKAPMPMFVPRVV